MAKGLGYILAFLLVARPATAEPVKCDYDHLPELINKKLSLSQSEVTTRISESRKDEAPHLAMPAPVETASQLPPEKFPVALDPLDQKIKVAQIFEQIPVLSERFKLSLLTGSYNSYGDFSIAVPWPPEDKNGKIQIINFKEVVNKLGELIGKQKAEEVACTLGVCQVSNRPQTEFPLPMPPTLVANAELETKIFTFVRDQLIQLVRDGKTESELGDEQRLAIKKLMTIKFISSSDKTQWTKACEDRLQAYHFFAHEAAICSIQDVSTSLKNLALEMSGLLSPCKSQFEIFKVDIEKLKALVEKERFADTDLGIKSMGFTLLDALKTNDMINESAFFSELTDGDAIRDLLIKEGVVKERIAGTPFLRYPFKETLRCFSSPKYGFKTQSDEEISRFVDTVVASRRVKFGTDYDPQLDRKTLPLAFRQNPHCIQRGVPSQMDDVMMHWMTTRIYDTYVKAYPEDSHRPLFSLLNVLPFQPLKSSASIILMKAGIDFSGSTMLSQRQIQENFVLQAPAIRALLGCDAKEPSECFGNPAHEKKSANQKNRSIH